MNILFVNYGDFTTNSLNHLAGFASALADLGHACAIAVPADRETVAAVPAPRFIAVTYAEALAAPPFPDGRPADLLHAWTPREGVRKFVLAHQRLHPATRVLVHLEDNEEHLIEAFGGQPIATLRDMPQQRFPFPMVDGLSHPIRHRHLLRLADAVTVINDRLREFVPAGRPVNLLLPGVDFQLYAPRPADPALRRELGLRDAERVIAFTGSVTFANAAEIAELYRAVRQLNTDGCPTRLLHTGHPHPHFAAALEFDPATIALELGFIPKERLPALLALADVLVQPGAAGPFNDYRLPSKLPEFLASGRPVVLPAANVGRELTDGTEALLLRDDTAAEIVRACRRVFADPALAARLGAAGAAFARARFDLHANTAGLAGFYTRILAAPPNPAWAALPTLHETELPLLAAQLDRDLAPPAEVRAQLAELGAGIRQLDADLHERAGTLAHLRQHAAALEQTRDTLNRDIALVRAQAAEHARQLEQAVNDLQRALRDRDQHIQHIEGANRDLAQHIQRLEAANQTLAGHLRQLEHRLHHLDTSLARLVARTHALGAEAELATARLQEALRQSEHRVRRLQASFSWRATAWLRYLRRVLVDPLRRPTEPPLPPPAPTAFRFSPEDFTLLPQPAPAFHAALDAPSRWPAAAAQIQIRGWVALADGDPILAVRARIGDRLHPGDYGLTRPDVGQGHPSLPAALHSGFKIPAALETGDEKVLLEFQTADGAWHVFVTQLLGQTHALPVRGTYEHWVRAFDTPDPATLDALRVRAAALRDAPLISVLMPVFNPAERWLDRAIASVRAQVYPHWELCIADDASTFPHVRAVLERHAREEPRIKLCFRSENGHISAASNSALALATGAYCALLDHDDELAPHALACVAETLQAHPDTELVYSDEDKIDETGLRFDPYFKPDWNPELILGQNFVCHLAVLRTARLRSLGGFRLGYEGSQDWDLILRASTGLDRRSIHHIPRVLYHWRAIPGSTALQLGEKADYPVQAARQALIDHLARTGVAAELLPVTGGHWRIKRTLAAPHPKVSIMIPTRNGELLVRRCIDSLRTKSTYPNYEILLIDNRSDDPAALAYFAALQEQGVRVIHHDVPFNFSAINNHAAAAASGEILAFLNNDLELISSDWLEELVSHAVRPEVGCVGALLYYPDNTVQHAGAILGIAGPAGKDGVAGHAFKTFPRGAEGQRNRLRLVQNYSAVTAACLVIRKAIFQEVGGFNERDLAVAFNDIDFCLRVRAAGYRNLWTPFAEFYHHESASRGFEDTPEKIARFNQEVTYMRRTWGPLLDADPAYNPNLTFETEDFGLAYPPRVPPLAQPRSET